MELRAKVLISMYFMTADNRESIVDPFHDHLYLLSERKMDKNYKTGVLLSLNFSATGLNGVTIRHSRL